MKQSKLFPITIFLMMLLFIAGIALAQGNYDLSWWTTDGGAGVSNGGGYTMTGTLAQVDAGPLLRGGEYTLAGGFWRVGGPVVYSAYLPVLTKDPKE